MRVCLSVPEDLVTELDRYPFDRSATATALLRYALAAGFLLPIDEAPAVPQPELNNPMPARTDRGKHMKEMNEARRLKKLNPPVGEPAHGEWVLGETPDIFEGL